MKRSTAREIAVHISFEMAVNDLPAAQLLSDFFDREHYATLAEEADIYEEYPDERQMEYIKRLAKGVTEHAAELDMYIEKYSKDWSISRISRVAAAIMRVAMFEILYMQDDIPHRVAVNEAVELAKKYEERETVSFINGILGTFIKKELTMGE
ncbi:MAG: transcription antitermination factor NusB [Clostridiales bacterium]|nr:transcription antitermination factor NusB [Clostridiales bacterium]